MAYWLLKSEPHSWSWQDQVKYQKTSWDGVRNYQASNHLKAMHVGDFAFFYHSGKEKQIVGIVEVISSYKTDPSDLTGRFGMVDVKTVRPLLKPVPLKVIKADPRLAQLALTRQPRLSVMPVKESDWHILCQMGGI